MTQQQSTQQPITDEQAVQALSRLRSASYQHLVAARAVHKACEQDLAVLAAYVRQASSAEGAATEEEA